MRRRKGTIEVEAYRDYSIELDKDEGKFIVREVGGEDAPVDTLQQARNAIDRHIKTMNEGVRRKVLTLADEWEARDIRKIKEGELSSWSRSGGRVEAVVVYGEGDRRDREKLHPSRVYEDTEANRALLAKVIENDRAVEKLRSENTRILDKQIERAKIAPAFTTKG